MQALKKVNSNDYINKTSNKRGKIKILLKNLAKYKKPIKNLAKCGIFKKFSFLNFNIRLTFI